MRRIISIVMPLILQCFLIHSIWADDSGGLDRDLIKGLIVKSILPVAYNDAVGGSTPLIFYGFIEGDGASIVFGFVPLNNPMFTSFYDARYGQMQLVVGKGNRFPIEISNTVTYRNEIFVISDKLNCDEGAIDSDLFTVKSISIEGRDISVFHLAMEAREIRNVRRELIKRGEIKEWVK